tara:strand:- start:831 stop:1238 length:408 start_codon:yes stop_codon:yes gene_type:complete
MTKSVTLTSVTFTNTTRSFSITKNILLTDVSLNISDTTYDNIEFKNEVKIIVFSGAVRDEIEQEKHIEVLERTVEKIRPCRMLWNGYGKYNNYKGIICDKKCDESKCNNYKSYADYIKNKNMRSIPQFIKLVVES